MLKSHYLHVDETVVQILKEHGFYKVAVGEDGARLFGSIARQDLDLWVNGSLTLGSKVRSCDSS